MRGNLLIGVCVAMVVSSGVASGTLLDRTFVRTVPVVLLEWTGGIGIFDADDPTNSCLALVTFETVSSGTGAYYEMARIFPNLGNRTTHPSLVLQDTGDPDGIDPTDCLGFTTNNPNGESVGTSGGTAAVGYLVMQNAILGATQVPSAGNWTLEVIPITSATTPTTTSIFASPPLVGSGPSGRTVAGTSDPNPLDYSACLVLFVSGSIDSDPFCSPLTSDLVPCGAGDSVVESNLDADLFDVSSGVSTVEEDESWFVVRDLCDTSVLPDGPLALVWGLDQDAPASFHHIDALVDNDLDA